MVVVGAEISRPLIPLRVAKSIRAVARNNDSGRARPRNEIAARQIAACGLWAVGRRGDWVRDGLLLPYQRQGKEKREDESEMFHGFLYSCGTAIVQMYHQ